MERFSEELSLQAGRLMEGLCLEEAACQSEVAMPCYTGERGKRYSAELYRVTYEGGPGRGPLYPSNALSPRSSDNQYEGPATLSPRSSQYEGPAALSPRSSYASTASDTSKHSSPRASLTGYDGGGSKPSSNRTSGISMGYDQRHASPRSSTASQYSCTTSPRSSYSSDPPRYPPAANHEPDALASPRSSLCLQDGRAATLGPCNPSVASPRSSISSHSSRSSRSSRGSLGAYGDPPVPSPRSSVLLGPSGGGIVVQEEDAGGEPCHYRVLAQPARHDQQEVPGGVSYNFSAAKGSATLHRFKVPYQVTPSKESGPSQAERRLEALTLELEKELEMHMKKEYFGICIKCGKGVYGASQACQAMGNLFHTNCFTCCSCGKSLLCV
ncbi:Wilms tumor protein 1-interacting protein [Mantella aurantiaca]